MKIDQFDYDLPEDLIAQYPCANRGDSRLLCLDCARESISDHHFPDIRRFMKPGDTLVLNDTRVIPARMYGQKESGGQVEILLERILPESGFLAQIKASKSPKPGTRLLIDGVPLLEVMDREGDFFRLRLTGQQDLQGLLKAHGHVPLPPYIARDDVALDEERYQTVYASQPGAVAAPTAGLHFTGELLQQLAKDGIKTVKVTLHVGAGTFQPVRVENIEEHAMHREYYVVSEAVVDAIRDTKSAGGRVIAVGTTSLRSLESAAISGELRPASGETDLFIYPGFEFRVVDALVTNFHLPRSTLLMLVSAFAGMDLVQRAYAHAVRERYRFFSYGDAMFINRSKQ
ncbi:MAG: tRNA preQ1(34) S-adenosylmethionine ribosyltransferase-isomerase QueA [Gammaproteobacteria bacterium]|nr:tRNA preQ1(34) S-adenosylmethionine ribosyltransferase-isomerase QueA [Gammaproteobacteria bacterium]